MVRRGPTGAPAHLTVAVDREPDSTMCPSRMMDTRSHSASTWARMWLDSSTVRPACLSSRTQPAKMFSINGSSPAVGSSRTSSSTSDASAATMATFCRLPFE
jgi:hypothetical protein